MPLQLRRKVETRSPYDDVLITRVLSDIGDEAARAFNKFPKFNSPHEGYAVIVEEVEELWEKVKANEGKDWFARAEAIQVAAMALRYVVDLCVKDITDPGGTPWTSNQEGSPHDG